MIKRIFFVVLLCWVSLASEAQNLKACLNLGFTASQIEGDELKGFHKYGVSTGVGILAPISRNRHWQVGVETNITQRGAFNASSDPYNIRLTLNYVDIPLTIYYHDPKGGMYFGTGLAYGRLVQQPHGFMQYKDDYFVPDTSDMLFLKNDITWVAEARFAVWRGLQFSLRYQSSIVAIKKDWRFIEYIHNQPETWYNNLYNRSVTLRLLWVLGDDGSHYRRGRR